MQVRVHRGIVARRGTVGARRWLTLIGADREAVSTHRTEPSGRHARAIGGMTATGATTWVWFRRHSRRRFRFMWIQNTNTDSEGNPVTEHLRHPDVDDDVAFTANGKAKVTREVGEQATQTWRAVEPVEADDSGDAGDDDSDATDDTADE